MAVAFGAICNLLQRIENITTQQPKRPADQEKKQIQEIVTKWFSNQRDALDHPKTNGGAVLSALFPQRRRDRVYGLQAPLLAKKLGGLLNFNYAQKTVFGGWQTAKAGDLGIYIEEAMKPWDGTFSSKRDFSMNEIDHLLVQLAARYRFSNEAIRKQRDRSVNPDTALKEVLIRLESWEAKWLIRLILRDLCTIELDERHVLGTYHFLLPDLLLFQNDFDVVFNLLRTELSDFPAIPLPNEANRLRLEAGKRLTPAIGVKVGRPTFYKAWSLKHCFDMVGDRLWAADIKYDGEYCEIHIDTNNKQRQVTIFSKNGKDATTDREQLHPCIRHGLRIGEPDCLFKSKCIILGEMVLYSDKEKKILPFHKIRKHVSRSGAFLGTLQDSLPHAWEHLMIVFFDVLLLDDNPVLRQSLQDRRNILRDLIRQVPGRSMRSEWTLLDFRTGDGITDFKQVFARNLANRQEGLILKPLFAPYFPLLTEQGRRQAGFFIKVKKDYLNDMGGERDLGDYAVVGASYDAQLASKIVFKPVHWTHFYLGCCTNKAAVKQSGVRPTFKIVASLSIDGCIPKTDARYLNVQGYVSQEALRQPQGSLKYDIAQAKGTGPHMTVAFKQPFVAEVLGGGYEKVPNEVYEMLRHPRIIKLHNDRTWEDCVTLDELIGLAEQKWEVPNANKLDGHAKDVAILTRKYVKEMDSQRSSSTCKTTQETTQRSEEVTPLRAVAFSMPTSSDTVVPESQASTSTSSTISSSRRVLGKRARTSQSSPILIHEDTCERLTTRRHPILLSCTTPVVASIHCSSSTTNTALTSKRLSITSCITITQPQPPSEPQSSSLGSSSKSHPSSKTTTTTKLNVTGINSPSSSCPMPTISAQTPPFTIQRVNSFSMNISPPAAKRRKVLTQLNNTAGSKRVGGFEFDS